MLRRGRGCSSLGLAWGWAPTPVRPRERPSGSVRRRTPHPHPAPEPTKGLNVKLEPAEEPGPEQGETSQNPPRPRWTAAVRPAPPGVPAGLCNAALPSPFAPGCRRGAGRPEPGLPPTPPPSPPRPGRATPRLLQDNRVSQDPTPHAPLLPSYLRSRVLPLDGPDLANIRPRDAAPRRCPKAPSGGRSRDVQAHVAEAAVGGAGKTPDPRGAGLTVWGPDGGARHVELGTCSSPRLLSTSQPARRAPHACVRPS